MDSGTCCYHRGTTIVVSRPGAGLLGGTTTVVLGDGAVAPWGTTTVAELGTGSTTRSFSYDTQAPNSTSTGSIRNIFLITSPLSCVKTVLALQRWCRARGRPLPRVRVVAN